MSTQATAKAPVQTPVEDFNRRVLENGWAVLCDPVCRFSASLLLDALELWRKTANGSIPYRRDMTARRLRPFIPVLSIYERVRHPGGGWRYRTRLMGTKLAFTTIEMSNRFVDEVIAEPYLTRWHALGETVLAHGKPLRIVYSGISLGKPFLVNEAMVAPLLTNDGKADLIMSVTSFDGIDSWKVVEEQTLRQLGIG